ncbi:hypothetical protein M405DRAFT_882715 [Rhizopogon salebrosus TDB-379]|nr:hypothetical protein M405DRAFT_882715 [Rhizopogon salebrosus TDB-379]
MPMPTDFFGYTTSIPIPRSILDLEKPSSVHAYHGGFGTCDECCCLAFIFLQQYQLSAVQDVVKSVQLETIIEWHKPIDRSSAKHTPDVPNPKEGSPSQVMASGGLLNKLAHDLPTTIAPSYVDLLEVLLRLLPRPISALSPSSTPGDSMRHGLLFEQYFQLAAVLKFNASLRKYGSPCYVGLRAL